MTLVVVGIDALDAELVENAKYSNLTLNAYSRISTLESSTGELSTHELWPTIFTGLRPREHGLTLESGLSWDSPILRYGASAARHILPRSIRTIIGAWVLNNTEVDVFRTPSTYYPKNGLSTLFDGFEAKAIGIPNYVTEEDGTDREHELRRSLGDMFERTSDRPGGHISADPDQFYEQCLEMAMIRIARIRRAFRSGRYELVFGYTSGLDLIGHVAYDSPELQTRAYEEVDEFVGELRADLGDQDTLVLISDHGLQRGIHTRQAMIASQEPRIVDAVDTILDVRAALEAELADNKHMSERPTRMSEVPEGADEQVRQHLEDLGYF